MSIIAAGIDFAKKVFAVRGVDDGLCAFSHLLCAFRVHSVCKLRVKSASDS